MALMAALSRTDLVVLAMLVVGWLAMFGPTYVRLAETTWATDEQGHGPIILAVSAWLLYRRADDLRRLEAPGAPIAGGLCILIGLLAYVVGRSQSIALVEVGAQIPVLAGLLLAFKGRRGLRLGWFSLFFLIFMCPLPSDLVAYVTGPLKSAVSAAASSLLFNAGYPVGRMGVILTVGPYQLLVADACAGLNSMFTLEALGLLYLNLMHYTSTARNVALAIAIIPISFCANVVRVCVLVLITYHFGDEAGQGFLHGFSGMVLFAAALVLMLAFDRTVGEYIDRKVRPS
jgi:exosortase B